MSESAVVSPVTRKPRPARFRLLLGLVVAAGLTACAGAEPASGPTVSPSTSAAESVVSSAAITTSTSAADDAVAPSSAPASWASIDAPEDVEVVTVELGDRPFLLYRPIELDPNAPLGLIVALHGYTAEALGTVPYFGLESAPVVDGLLVAVPQGSTDSAGDNFWNASDVCCNFHRSEVDDVAYLADVITTVEAEFPVDPNRVYVIGHSNGGYMANRLACDRPELVTSIISFAGAFDTDPTCEPKEPVNVMVLHGDADEVVFFEGARAFTSAAETLGVWAKINGCTGTDAEVGPVMDANGLIPGDDLFTTRSTGCTDGTKTDLWRLAGSQHVQEVTPALSRAIIDWFVQGPA